MSTSARIAVADSERMIAEGRFEPREEHHVELLEGEIVPLGPIDPGHRNAVSNLTEWSVLNAPLAEVRVVSRGPVGIPELDSVPEPDIARVRRGNGRRKHPTAADVLPLVEVADSWIVNIPDECIEVRRDPRQGAYQSVTTFRPGESVPLLAFPTIALPVATLFDDGDGPAEG